MDGLQVYLFGKFCACFNGQPLVGLEARKIQELFSYLLIYRNRSHPREKLANLLWENSSRSQSKQYLRQTLWQLQSIFDEKFAFRNKVFVIESGWIQINPTADYWLDIAQIEEANAMAHGRRGHELDKEIKNALLCAIQLYRGELLENWYQDWCIFERERFQNMYLIMLDKLMEYSEAYQEYEQGIVYGTRILRCDVARERTYRRLMRLHYLAGDRTGALRQYEHCLTALEQELGAKPANHTIEIYNQIKQDQLLPVHANIESDGIREEQAVGLPEVLNRLTHVQQTLIDAQNQIERDIEVVKTMLEK